MMRACVRPAPRRALVVLVAPFAAACGFWADGKPMVEAHRGGAGYWPENSRTAITEAFKRDYPAIEFDLGMTRDLVPVLSHDAWLNDHCTKADGSPIESEVLIRDLTLADLHERYRCGGVPDEKMIAAGKALAKPVAAPVVKADTHMTFAELLELAKAHPQVTLHVDLKYEPEKTQPAEQFAERVVGAIRASGIANPWFVSTPWPEAVAPFKALGATVVFQWPRFGPPRGDTAVALEGELLSFLGVREVADEALELKADGVSLPYQVLDLRAVEVAKERGLQVLVWTMNTDTQLDMYCRFPADRIVTDFPESAPCL